MASNRNALKKYAPQARLDFIQAVTNRAAQFGITKDGNDAGEAQGDLFILNGKAFPRSVANQRGRLISRIARDGFAQTMEAVAYTWFNRFLAIRYMELHDYLSHGYRVLSNPAGHAEPEILEKATSVELPGLDRDGIVNFKLDGTKDEQIYRKLLIAQCNDLHRAMPFLFEKIDDETELLLPENLLQSDSIVRKLVNEIAEEEWQEIEIIGWLYQFYISEKKDEVIGKVVKSEDIPAATQLFTPNWIVKYMVQNSLGAQWLATYPDSGIRTNYPMEYYIAPAEQTPEVQAQIDAITPKQLDPEAITLIDPAVGSGHILVEAYDLFRAIYLERGYTKREAARAILTKNLFGLDIDDRAAQMAGFALLMKACADDRTVLSNPPKLNVLALQDSEGLDADVLAKALLPQEQFAMVPSGDILPETLTQPTLEAQQPASAAAKAIKELVTLFDGAKTFGSLIKLPDSVMQSLPLLNVLLAKPLTGDLLLQQAQREAQEMLKSLVEQARLLGGRYDCVVANPPYIGSKGLNPRLKKYLQDKYESYKSDVFSAFIVRCSSMNVDGGSVGIMSPNVWMYIKSHEYLRYFLTKENVISNLVELPLGGFKGATVQICTFTFRKKVSDGQYGAFVSLKGFKGGDSEMSAGLAAAIANPDCGWFFRSSACDFERIPGNPIAYSASRSIRNMFCHNLLGEIADTRLGMATADNGLFLRFWHEVKVENISFNAKNREEANISKKKWFLYQKGGEFRKWFGNNDYVVNWENDGFDIQNFKDESTGKVRSHNYNLDYIFSRGVTWNALTSGNTSARISENSLFDNAGSSLFSIGGVSPEAIMSFINSKVMLAVFPFISPTLNYQPGDIAKLPAYFPNGLAAKVDLNASLLIAVSKSDWDGYEVSWDFKRHPLLTHDRRESSLSNSFAKLASHWVLHTKEAQRLEEENNRLFIDAYGLQDELKPDVTLSEITLRCNPHYRYGADLTNEQREVRLKSDTFCELISYIVGCMMGRYSLAEPGLIYAHSGGVGFDPSRYGPFPADDDGIIPMTEEQWFADDAATRIEEFLGVAWPDAPIMETMTTLMDGLTMGKAGEPRAALRSYLSKQFYKDHLQTYKNRPIYWLFSSGKQKAFEALVYLHRYNEGTLARMRTIYVTPLMGKLQQRISDLDAEIAASSSSADKTRKTREKDKLAKQVVELRAFDEELRHLADQRIPLDLDDGVKVNYARFGNLLAAKDKVCPKKKGEDK